MSPDILFLRSCAVFFCGIVELISYKFPFMVSDNKKHLIRPNCEAVL